MTKPKVNKLFAHGLSRWNAFVASYQGPYDFSKSVYAGMNNKVNFICPVHGEMYSDAKNLMNGKKCLLCALEDRKGRLRITQGKMLARFREFHEDKYDYSEAVYRGQQTPVLIKCPEHGPFWQKPEFHWTGSGCPECFHQHRRGSSSRDTLESFSLKLTAKFGALFSIEDSVYINSQTEIKVRCTKHDLTCKTKPNWILNGYNPCPKCNSMKSKGEAQVFTFLSNLVPAINRDRTLLRPKELDIYLPEQKLAIEYCGEYHHSVKSKEDEKANRRKHIEKYRACEEQGVRLITLWESEWKDRNYAIRRLLRNAVGKSKGKLMARKCELRKAAHDEAKAFYDRYHPQGGSGTGEHYALFWKGKMVACMRFVLGANDRGAAAKKRVWTLGRYATRITVAGAASRLFQAFLKEHNPPEVKSFSDNRMFGGGMYEQLGFTLEENVGEDYVVWSPKIGIRPKPHYQRRALPKRLEEHGVDEVFDPAKDPRTEAEMTYMMGCGRLYDCGKKRWVWTALV